MFATHNYINSQHIHERPLLFQLKSFFYWSLFFWSVFTRVRRVFWNVCKNSHYDLFLFFLVNDLLNHPPPPPPLRKSRLHLLRNVLFWTHLPVYAWLYAYRITWRYYHTMTISRCLYYNITWFIDNITCLSRDILAWPWEIAATEKTIFPFKLNGIWLWWQFFFRFWTKRNSIWFKIERKAVITIMSHSMWEEMEI